MEIMGYLFAALIGMLLGLIGGGGSILTVPVMVYLFSVQPALATSYSLFIVGSASLVGAYANYRQGLVNVKTALLFSISSIITIFLVRKFIIPAIPQTLGKFGGYAITESMMIMFLFALLMLLASVPMISGGLHQRGTRENTRKTRFYKLSFYGIGVGLVAGLLGIGGGFLIIPTLVLLVGLPIREAIGTSLLIIAFNSFFGFAGDIGNFTIAWLFLLKITAIAIAGILAGYAIGRKIKGHWLKKGFGWFLLLVACCIIMKELFLAGTAGAIKTY